LLKLPAQFVLSLTSFQTLHEKSTPALLHFSWNLSETCPVIYLKCVN